MQSEFSDTFSNAKSYESYVGRWSRLVAKKFIAWMAIPPQKTWLDLGAGTGILSQIILQEASPTKVIGIDLSQEYIDFARQHIQDNRIEFKVGDALNTVSASPEFDLAVAGLVLNFLPSPQQAVQSMIEAVKAGGMVAAYVWDYSGQMEMMRYFWDAASKVDPASSEMDAGQRFTICNPDGLRDLFQSLGLEAVEAIPIDVPTHFADFDDYWLPFLGAQGSVAKYMRGLDDTILSAIREQIRTDLPIQDDGSISLIARAWAVKGKKAI